MGTRLRVGACAAMLAMSAQAPASPLFQASSKHLGDGTMDIVLTEIERRPRTSVIDVTIHARGSSVGGSMFIACSLRELARERGGRHIAILDGQPRPNQMLIGFLRDAGEDPSDLGAEFANVRRPQGILDLDQLAPLCRALQ